MADLSRAGDTFLDTVDELLQEDLNEVDSDGREA